MNKIKKALENRGLFYFACDRIDLISTVCYCNKKVTDLFIFQKGVL